MVNNYREDEIQALAQNGLAFECHDLNRAHYEHLQCKLLFGWYLYLVRLAV